MQILRVSVEADREKIEIRQIGEQYQHAESRKPLAPLCSEPSLQLRCQEEEGPEAGKTVRYWRGHEFCQRFGLADPASAVCVQADSGTARSLS